LQVELQLFPTYTITPVEVQDIHLSSGKVVQNHSPIIIEEEIEEVFPTPMIDNSSPTVP